MGLGMETTLADMVQWIYEDMNEQDIKMLTTPAFYGMLVFINNNKEA